jgi:hypothetical protein
MSADRFLAHLHEEDFGFICYPAGLDSPKRIQVSVVHELGTPATAEQLAKLRELLGATWSASRGVVFDA